MIGRRECVLWLIAPRTGDQRSQGGHPRRGRGGSGGGGGVGSARAVVVALAVGGDLGGREPVPRSGARPGDVLAVAGRLGWAAAGLAVLRRGFRSPVEVVGAQRVPAPPYAAGP